MASNFNSDNQDGINEINITPFVDIVLVLLIIFMISAPALVYRGMQISLPESKNGNDMSHVTFKFELNASGELYLESKKAKLADVPALLDKVIKAGSSFDALVSADGKLPYQTVIALVDELKSLGFESVGFATSKKK